MDIEDLGITGVFLTGLGLAVAIFIWDAQHRDGEAKHTAVQRSLTDLPDEVVKRILTDGLQDIGSASKPAEGDTDPGNEEVGEPLNAAQVARVGLDPELATSYKQFRSGQIPLRTLSALITAWTADGSRAKSLTEGGTEQFIGAIRKDTSGPSAVYFVLKPRGARPSEVWRLVRSGRGQTEPKAAKIPAPSV